MKNISGQIYQYYFICPRKMWLFSNGIALESENENVQIGKLIDETSYSREQKHILIEDYANIDFFKNKTICETKKSSKHDESAIAQIKYYLFILHNMGVDDISGELRIPKENKIQAVKLSEEDISEIENNLKVIKDILENKMPPKCEKIKICRSCAYFELCFI